MRSASSLADGEPESVALAVTGGVGVGLGERVETGVSSCDFERSRRRCRVTPEVEPST